MHRPKQHEWWPQFNCNTLYTGAIDIGGVSNFLNWKNTMARTKNLENMSAAELAAMQARIERMKIEKQNAERAAVRQQLMDIANKAGFDIRELLDGRAGKRGKVAAKYRDPKNPENTWTGRGRPPRWLAAATKGGKAKKEDFLIA